MIVDMFFGILEFVFFYLLNRDNNIFCGLWEVVLIRLEGLVRNRGLVSVRFLFFFLI